MVLYAEVSTSSSMSWRRTGLIGVAVAGCFLWWGLRTPRLPMPGAGPAVEVGAEGPAHAIRQVFVVPVSTLSSVKVTVRADAPVRLAWTLDLASQNDPFRRGRRVAAGAVDVADGRRAVTLKVDPPASTTRSEAALGLWFEGAGAGRAMVESSGLDAYPGRFGVGDTTRFGDLRLEVSGLNLYSDLRVRLSSAPPWLRAPLVHVTAIVIFLAAITGFIAEVTAARGEQG
jgi:hypothetical protein